MKAICEIFGDAKPTRREARPAMNQQQIRFTGFAPFQVMQLDTLCFAEFALRDGHVFFPVVNNINRCDCRSPDYLALPKSLSTKPDFFISSTNRRSTKSSGFAFAARGSVSAWISRVCRSPSSVG